MTTVDFDIPYIFSVTGIPKRGTKKRQGFFFERIPASFPVVDADDAPVAVTFAEQFHHQTYVGEGGVCTLRYHDGKLFQKVLSKAIGDTFDTTPQMLADYFEGGVYAIEYPDRLDPILPSKATTMQRGLFPQPDDGNPIKPFREDQWSSYDRDHREKARREAEERIDSLIVIDGQFWKTVPEPRYVMSFQHADVDARHDSVYVYIENPEVLRKSRGGSEYGLTHWDQLVHDSETKWGITPSDENRADILIPAAFPHDDAMEKFRGEMLFAINHDGDMLKSFEPVSMLDWAALRDAYRLASECDFTEPTLNALAGAAETYSNSRNASGRARDAIAVALELLDAREITVPGIPPGGPSPR